MKEKFLFAGIAAVMLVSCSENEMIVENEMNDSAIAFSTYVNNSSRADETKTANLTKFKVWATKTVNASTSTSFTTMLDGVDVQKTPGKDIWTYSPTKYWVKENAYSFTGIGSMTGKVDNYYTYTLPSSVDAGNFLGRYMGSISFNNEACAGAEDIVWASTKVGTVTTNPGVVKFDFKHLLSRVNLKFVNVREIDQETSIRIEDVKIITASTGTLDFSQYATSVSSNDFKWVPSCTQSVQNAAGTYECSFDFNAAADAHGKVVIPNNGIAYTENKFLLPAQDVITVQFKVYTSITGDDYITITRNVEFNSIKTNEAFKDIILKPGYSYTLVAYISNDLDNLGQIILSVASVEEYKDAIANPFLFDVNFGPEPTFYYFSSSSLSSIDNETISVTSVELNKYGELVYYGQNPKTFIPEKYTYEWTLDPNNNVVTFADGTFTKTYPANSVTNVSDLDVEVKFVGSRTAHADVPATLTIRDENGNIVVQESIPVHFVLRKSGGSNDGDDNDG